MNPILTNRLSLVSVLAALGLASAAYGHEW
jgi:hypothetical protein